MSLRLFSSGSDMLLDDTGGDGGMRKEGRHVKVVVSLDEDSKWTEVKYDFLSLRCIPVQSSWSFSSHIFSFYLKCSTQAA